jgi:hypothetical protein
VKTPNFCRSLTIATLLNPVLRAIRRYRIIKSLTNNGKYTVFSLIFFNKKDNPYLTKIPGCYPFLDDSVSHRNQTNIVLTCSLLDRHGRDAVHSLTQKLNYHTLAQPGGSVQLVAPHSQHLHQLKLACVPLNSWLTFKRYHRAS